MLDWKRIDKEPPPKDGREILLCDALITHSIYIGWWDNTARDGHNWCSPPAFYSSDAFTHWAEIGPLPTMETGE